jgi:hypothetical protein
MSEVIIATFVSTPGKLEIDNRINVNINGIRTASVSDFVSENGKISEGDINLPCIFPTKS